MSSVPNVGVFALDDDLVELLGAVDQVCTKLCTASVVAGADPVGLAAFRRELAEIGVLGLLQKDSLLVRVDATQVAMLAPESVVSVSVPGRLTSEWSEVKGEIGVLLPNGPAIVGALEVLWSSYLAGACDRMIRTGAGYAASRIQFGRPIGSNQAISHPLAQCINASFAVEASARLAARRLSTDPSRRTEAAAAYLAAARLTRRVCRVVPQTFGAIGISVEGPGSAMLQRLPMAGVVPSVAESAAVVASAVFDGGAVQLPFVGVDLPHDVEVFREEVATYADTRRDVHGYVRDEQTRAAVKEVCRELGKKGWLSLSWAPQYGGAGKSVLHEFVLWDELAYADVTRPPTGDGHVAEYLWLLCRTGTPESRSRGLTILLVDMGLSGITISPIHMLDGARLNEIHFNDVFVPQSSRVGVENAAWTIITDSLTVERYVQMPPKKLQADFELLARWLSEQGRIVDGLLRVRMAELAVEVSEVATAAATAVLAHEAELPAAVIATHAKLLFASTTQHIADTVLEFGGDRLPGAHELHAVWLQSLGETLGGGSTEILRTSLARMELGLAVR